MFKNGRFLFLFLVCTFVAGSLRGSPAIGLEVQSWNYDALTKVLTLHLANTSNKDITAYGISMTVRHTDGTADSSEIMDDLLPLMAGVAADQNLKEKYGNGTFVTGTTRDEILLQTKDVTDVLATVDLVAYSDRSVHAQNQRALDHLIALRNAQLAALQETEQALTQSLAYPNPRAAAATELKRRAYVAKGRNSESQVGLLSAAQEVSQSADLAEFLKRNAAKILFVKSHRQLVKEGQ